MLEIEVPKQTVWDESIEKFITIDSFKLHLEHSLLAISIWESKWHKPFLSENDKTREEMVDYIRCMTLDEGIEEYLYNYITENNLREINAYIDNPMTATTIREDPNAKHNHEIITSEIIYYWMITAQIPFECERWHLNRLLMLVRVCGIKNSPDKKMSQSEVLARQRSLNKARRKKK